MHISICIVGFRNAAEIARCVSNLAAQSHHQYDIVICENGGAESYGELVSLVPTSLPGGQAVECIQADGNIGYAGGVNVCMRARPRSDGWWVVNADTQPAPDALERLVERLQAGDCHAVGGTLYHPGGKVQAYGGHWRAVLGRSVSLGMGADIADVPDVRRIERRMNYILGASMLVDRHYVETVGMMREDYFLYCEEVEWGLRGVAKGLRPAFAPASLVQHGQGGVTGSAAPIRDRPRLPIYMDERNKLHVVRDTTPWLLPVAIPATLVLLTLRYLPRLAWRQWGYALDGWRAGVRGVRGRPDWVS